MANPDFAEKMKTFLVDLSLDRVDLVKEGANSKAHIKLLKRKELQTMNFEEIMKTLKPEHAAVITKAIEDIRAEKPAADVVELTKSKESIVTLNAELAKSKTDLAKALADLEVAKTGKKEEDDLEVLMKSVNPALAKHIEELQKSVNAMVNEKAETIAKERFESVKALPVEETVMKDILKTVSPAVLEVLQKSAKAIEDGLLVAKGFDAEPATVGDTTAAYTKLEKSAKKLQEADSTMSFETAFLKAAELDPDTYVKLN